MRNGAIGVAMVGHGFMGRAHSNAYRQVGRFFDLAQPVRMKTVVGRDAARAEAAARQLGWEGGSDSLEAVLADPEIDVVDVVTPGDSHAEIVIRAAEAGKVVFCEKPIGNTLSEAERMAAAVRASGRVSAVFHNYRFAPAVALAKQLIEEGRIGRIYHFRAVYLQDWIADPEFPLVWRLEKEKTGSGAHGDINSHIIDLSRYLVGEIAAVSGMMETFVCERPLPDGSGRGRVTVDDATAFLARFEGGAMGTFEASRFARGRRNFNRFEINGSEGSVVFNLERMNELEFYDARDEGHVQGFRTISVTEAVHPYVGHFWPSGHIVGYEHTFIHLLSEALNSVVTGERMRPDMEDGLANQRVLDAVERSSAAQQWVPVAGA